MGRNPIAELRSESGQANATGTGSQSAAGQAEGQSKAQKLSGLIADIDLSDVPETATKEQFIKYLESKVKLYDHGYREKTVAFAEKEKSLREKEQAVDDLLKLKNEITDNPKLEKAVKKVINDFRSGRIEDPDRIIKTLDKYLEKTDDPEEREKLRDIRQIIREETEEMGSLKDELKSAKEAIRILQSMTASTHLGRVKSEMSSLKEDFGDVVDKYIKTIEDNSLKYPDSSAEKIFRVYASEEDLEKAYLYRLEKRKQKEQQRKSEGSSVLGSSVTESIQPKKDKFGRIDTGNLVRQLLGKT